MTEPKEPRIPVEPVPINEVNPAVRHPRYDGGDAPIPMSDPPPPPPPPPVKK